MEELLLCLLLAGDKLDIVHQQERFLLVFIPEFRGGAAPDGRLGAAVKVISGGGVAHVQIKVGVGIDKPGHEQLAGDINGPGQRVGEIAAHLENFLIFHQHVGPAGAPAGDYGAVFEQIFHSSTPY